MKNKVVYIVIAVVVVLALAIGIGIYIDQDSKNYVAKVDGVKITTAEYMFFLKDAKSNLEQRAGITSSWDAASVSAFWKDKATSTLTYADYAKQIALDQAQDFKIQIIKAKEAGLKLNQSDIDSVNTYINQIITNSGGKAAADTSVKSYYGISLNQLKAIYKEGKLQAKYSKLQEDKIKPTDKDLKQYYDENLEKAGVTTTVWHVLLATQDSAGKDLAKADMDAKAKLANDILTKVKSGVSFPSLVTQYSDDTGSKDTGGQYTIVKNQMVKEFETWAFNAKPGDTGIVKSQYGYHVMKKPTFDELKDTAKTGYIAQEFGIQLDNIKKDSKYKVVKNAKIYNPISVTTI